MEAVAFFQSCLAASLARILSSGPDRRRGWSHPRFIEVIELSLIEPTITGWERHKEIER